MVLATRARACPVQIQKLQLHRRSVLRTMAVIGTLALAGPSKADDATPETMFNNACRTCHSVKAGDNRLGPNLNAIVGRTSGAATGFNYSAAMKSANVTWDEATLDTFIANPDSVVPANNMKPFTGISDSAQRKGIIAYLKTGAKK